MDIRPTVKYLLFFLFGTISGYLLTYFISSSSLTVENNNESSVLSRSDTPLLTSNKNQANAHKPDKLSKTSYLTIKKEQSNSIEQVNSSENKSLSEKIIALEAENYKLEQKYQRTNNRLMEVTLEKESLDESNITDQQMMSLIDDESAQFRRQYKGKQRNDLYEFHQQEEDLNWGYQMKVRISDFIQTHYNSHLVLIESIVCKIDSCELSVSESENGAWSSIIKEVRVQPWWSFTSTRSSSRFGNNDRNLYYLYLSN